MHAVTEISVRCSSCGMKSNVSKRALHELMNGRLTCNRCRATVALANAKETPVRETGKQIQGKQ